MSLTDSRIGSKLLAAALGSLVAILMAEGLLRALGYGAIYDMYSKPSLLFERDELLGWSYTANAEATFVGPRPWPVEFSTPVRINSLGLRGPEVTARAEDELRILVLGDSRVAALEVLYEETFTALIEQDLGAALGRPTRVINAGVRGYGTDQSYLYYRDRGRHLEPDLVIFFASFNDSRNNMTLHRMRRPFGKSAFALRDDGELEALGVPIPEYPLCSAVSLGADYEIEQTASRGRRLVCWLQMKLLDHSALFTIASLVARESPQLVNRLYRMGDVADERRQIVGSPPARRLTTHLVLAMADIARADGAPLLVIGWRHTLRTLDSEALSEGGVEWVEIDSIEGASQLEIRFQHDRHLNALGHRRLADLLTRLLAERLGEPPPADR